MLRKPVLAFFVAAAIASIAVGARADYVTGLNPRGDNFLALRTGPGTSYRMILRMGPDTVVTVIGREGKWLNVVLEDGTEGWAFGDYIAQGFPPGYEPAEEDEESGFVDDQGVEDATEGPSPAVPEAASKTATVTDKDKPDKTAEAEDTTEPAEIAEVEEAPVTFDAWRAPLDEVLFTGNQTPVFLPHQAHGGVFDQHARYEGGALVVDVPPDHGWAKVGLLSNDPLVWLDDFHDDAITRVTFRLDPARTTGFGLSLTEASWGGVMGNDPGAPGARFYWIRTSDGTAATSELHVDPHGTDDFWKGGLPADAPSEVTFVLRPGTVAIELDGVEVAARGWPSLQRGLGLRIYAFSHPAEVQAAAKMALTGITVHRAYPEAPAATGPAPGVEPLPVEALFSGEPTPLLEPAAVAGGDFATFARYADGALVVEVPQGKSWGKTGFISAEPLVRLDGRARETPIRLTFQVDPKRTGTFTLALSSDKALEMWLNHYAWFAFIRMPDGDEYRMQVHASPYNDRFRSVPATWIDTYWDGTLEYDIADGHACMRIPGGPEVCAAMPTSVGGAYYATIMAHAPVADAPTSLALRSITRGLVTPPGMTADRRWFFIDDADFDPGQYLETLGALLK